MPRYTVTDEQKNDGDKRGLYHWQGFEWTGALPLGEAVQLVHLDAGNR
jgi:hypothetical protein